MITDAQAKEMWAQIRDLQKAYKVLAEQNAALRGAIEAQNAETSQAFGRAEQILEDVAAVLVCSVTEGRAVDPALAAQALSRLVDAPVPVEDPAEGPTEDANG